MADRPLRLDRTPLEEEKVLRFRFRGDTVYAEGNAHGDQTNVHAQNGRKDDAGTSRITANANEMQGITIILRPDAHEKKKRRKCEIKFHGRMADRPSDVPSTHGSVSYLEWTGPCEKQQLQTRFRGAPTSQIRKSTKKTARVEPEKHPRVQCGTAGWKRRDRDERKKRHGERGLSSGDIGREVALGRKGRPSARKGDVGNDKARRCSKSAIPDAELRSLGRR
ncbi:hypothetical protein B0H13DRAFT_1924444 [Mycena leptocephala]|nr:hypothetical protein B0H13DRAFT_1924444 [Mycena leptocephala]